MKKLRNIWYDIKEGVHNLIVWFPIIWKIRDFDYGYGVDLFIFYLKQLKKGITKYHNHLYWKNDIERIDKFLKMYDFYNKLGYFEQYKEQVEKEGIPPASSRNSATPKQRERDRELFLEYIKKQNRLEDILWRYLRQYLTTWWD